MFNEYENVAVATIALLRVLKVKVNNSTVDETLHNHPDYPSLLSVSDALTQWNVSNIAAKTESKEIEQLPVPFIAYTNYHAHPFVVVNKVNDTEVEAFTKSYSKTTSYKKEDFLKNWNGVYLLAEANEFSGEKNYRQNKINQLISQLIPALAVVLLAVISFLLIKTTPNPSDGGELNFLPIYLQYFILLAGVVVTTMLLWYEIDRNNPLLHKVCTGIIKGNCNAILTGKASKVFSWLSWSEVGFFYFAGSFLCLISNPSSPVAYAFNLLALPYIVFSIYYQGVVAKEWCLFCLSVQALLLLGGVNVIANGGLNYLHYSNFLNLTVISTALLLYLLPVLLWYSIKPVVLKLQAAKHTKREYLRLKFNTEIFNTLLQKQKSIELSSVEELGIDIGNPNATHTIIKVCNPYCGPCAKAHPKIEKLLQENPNIKAKIIFTATTDEKDIRSKPVKHLLAIAEKNNERLIKMALDDWYLAEKKDYNVFAQKYPLNGELKQQDDKITAMDKWCKKTDIQFTPTIFINGRQLPEAYNIEDLNYFLQE